MCQVVPPELKPCPIWMIQEEGVSRSIPHDSKGIVAVEKRRNMK